MNPSSLPKDTGPERIEAFIASLPNGHRREDFRRKLLSRAQTQPLKLVYGLGTSVEYPEIDELYAGATSAKHDVRVTGGATLRSFGEDEKLGARVERILDVHATTRYRSLGAALWRDAVVVDVKGEGTCMIKTMAAARHAELFVITVAQNTHAVITEQYEGEGNQVMSRSVVVLAGAGAQVEYRSQIAPSLDGTLFIQRYGVAEENARIDWYEVSLGGNVVKSEIATDLIGRKAASSIYFTLMNDKERRCDVEHGVRHSATDTRSRIVASGAARGKSCLVYRGNIDIADGMNGADGRQDARFVVLDPSAKVDAIPALEVHEGRVASGHALSVGYLSPTSLYYPKLRGMSDIEARGFLVSGIMKGMLAKGGASERDAYEMSRIAEVLDIHP